MKKIDHNDEEAYLFTPTPDWASDVKLKLQIPVETTTGRSDRSSSRVRTSSLRVTLYKFRTWILGLALRQMVLALRERTTERIILPLWCDDAAEDELAVFEASLYLTVDYFSLTSYDLEGSEYELHTERDNHSIGGQPVTVPCMYADFKEMPDADLNDDELVDYSFSFEEDAAIDEALRLPSPEFISETLELNGSEYPIFPFTPNFKKDQRAGSVEILARSRRVGNYRRLIKDYDGALPARELALRFDTFAHHEARDFLAFWDQVDGAAGRFLISSQIAPARLISAPGGNQIEVEDSQFLSVGMPIVLEQHNAADDETIHPAIITAIDEAAVTLDRSLPPLLVSSIGLRELILVSFDKSYISTNWDTDQSFSTTLEMREHPIELSPDLDEFSGVTIGLLMSRATLYTLRDERGTAYYYTDAERDLVHETQVYKSYPIAHSSITSSIDLTDRCKLSVELTEGSVFGDFFTVSSGTTLRLFLDLARVSLSKDGQVDSVLSRFRGELNSPKLKGTQMSFSARLLSRDMDARLPRLRFQRPCNYSFGSAGCAIDLDRYTYTARLDSLSATDGVLVVSAPLDASGREPREQFTEQLTGGVVVSGSERWLVLSVRQYDSIYEVKIGGNENLPAVGSNVQLVLGCNGSTTACQQYGNYSNFGGNRVANGNLSLVRVSSDVSSGGKK